MKKFFVYKSSAGSGKTYTLVKEYLALALSSPFYFRQILAITFTNKAANEMKQRVLTSLLHLSDPSAHKDSAAVRFMWNELAGRTGIPKEEIPQRAAGVLSMVIHHYDDFAIRTIDSFVSRIIRTFAHDLNLPADFRIELDRDLLLDEAIDKLIRKAGNDPDITRILVEFTESKADEERSWQLEGDLKKVGSYLFEEDGFQHAEAIRQITPAMILEFVKKIHVHRSAFENSMKEEASRALNLIHSSGISMDSFFYGKQGIGKYFIQLSEGKIELPKPRVTAAVDNNNWVAGKVQPDQRAAIERISGQLGQIFRNCERLLEEGFAGYKLLSLVNRQIYQLGVISEIGIEIEKIKREQRLIHVSEFNRYITGIILKEPVPFIYERAGDRFKNFLLDEFQDTSELQWKNLLPLISNSLAEGQFNLVVGDGKQAIYRFRNGQVEQFMLLPSLPESFESEVFQEAEKALSDNFKEELLDTNFRSLSEIIRFNNDFFGYAAQRLNGEFQEIYAKHEQKAVPGNDGGFVSIEFLGAEGSEEYLAATLSGVLDILEHCFASGAKKKDIVVLTRTNIQGNQVAKFLISQGIGVISSEALLLSASPEVNLLISALNYLQNPDDLISAASLLIHLNGLGLARVSPSELGGIVSGGHIISTLEESGIMFNSSYLRRLTLYDLCEELIRVFRLNLKGNNVYLQFFLEFVNRNVSGEIFQLQDLLELWEEKKLKLSVIVPEGIDSVRIMTIHKAKGLEFPVVILPFAFDKLTNTKDQVWIQPEHEALKGLPVALLDIGADLQAAGYEDIYEKERSKSLLDLINLVYVAFTRPCDQLFILTKEPKSSKSDTVNLQSLLKEYLSVSALPWKTEGSRFSLGVPVVRASKSDVRNSQPVSGVAGISGWQDRISIARRAPHGWSAETEGQPFEWGSLVHEALASVGSVHEVQNTVQNLVSKYILSEVEAETLRERVTSVLLHPGLAGIFTGAGRRIAESEILLTDGSVLRPDQVVFLQDQVAVIEYKTGQEKAEHRQQLEGYADALAGMGLKNIRKLLVYINTQVQVIEL